MSVANIFFQITSYIVLTYSLALTTHDLLFYIGVLFIWMSLHEQFSFRSWFSCTRELPSFFKVNYKADGLLAGQGVDINIECRNSGVSLWDVQRTLLLQRVSVISCSCIWFSLWLSAGDLMLSLGIGFFAYDSIRRRSEWISRGRLQRMGWAIALSSSNRTYPGHNFVATGAVNLQLLGRGTTFSMIIVHASLIVRIYPCLFK